MLEYVSHFGFGRVEVNCMPEKLCANILKHFPNFHNICYCLIVFFADKTNQVILYANTTVLYLSFIMHYVLFMII